jgi:hypothetical protein
MVTHYVSDYDGKRNSDAVDHPAEAPASFVEDVTAKVVAPEGEKSTPKKTATAKTKG